MKNIIKFIVAAPISTFICAMYAEELALPHWMRAMDFTGFMVSLAILLVCLWTLASIVVDIAEEKNLTDIKSWWILGFLFFLPALFCVLLKESKPDKATLKVCPHCFETIKKEAKICRYCGHEVK